MPLTESVGFKAVLQRGYRIQIPRVLRWRYKLEHEQVFKAYAQPVHARLGGQEFYFRMSQDGRLTIPKLIVDLLTRECGEPDLIGCPVEVKLQPA